MTQIVINHNGDISNYDALEGVGRFMLKNYAERPSRPVKQREIKANSGQLMLITENDIENMFESASCSFSIKKVKSKNNPVY